MPSPSLSLNEETVIARTIAILTAHQRGFKKRKARCARNDWSFLLAAGVPQSTIDGAQSAGFQFEIHELKYPDGTHGWKLELTLLRGERRWKLAHESAVGKVDQSAWSSLPLEAVL